MIEKFIIIICEWNTETGQLGFMTLFWMIVLYSTSTVNMSILALFVG